MTHSKSLYKWAFKELYADISKHLSSNISLRCLKTAKTLHYFCCVFLLCLYRQPSVVVLLDVYFIYQVWTTTDQRSMNTANVSFSTSSLLSPATTTSRSELILDTQQGFGWISVITDFNNPFVVFPGNSFSSDADERDQWQQDPHHQVQLPHRVPAVT